MPLKLAELRALAVAHTLFPKTTLARAIARLGFVQADPIRAPAPAQDLILRHRVRGYRAGDLERRYAELGIEEDYLYAYGFTTPAISNALHPRPRRAARAIEKRVLAVVREMKIAHPRDVAAAIGHSRVTNAWGGQSRATTHALAHLHQAGMLRIVRRDRGVRVYAPAPPRDEADRAARLRTLVLAIVNVLAPIRERTLRANVRRFRHLGDPRAAIASLVSHGTISCGVVDGETYVWPSTRRRANDDAAREVRFLAPFDPLVWDRGRFEQLWSWAYRFEAYTPKKKRVRAYYALPILFGDDVVGWASVSRDDVKLGFVRRPTEKVFARELEKETVRIRTSAHPVGSQRVR